MFLHWIIQYCYVCSQVLLQLPSPADQLPNAGGGARWPQPLASGDTRAYQASTPSPQPTRLVGGLALSLRLFVTVTVAAAGAGVPCAPVPMPSWQKRWRKRRIRRSLHVVSMKCQIKPYKMSLARYFAAPNYLYHFIYNFIVFFSSSHTK
uniref:Secreted protein n=1 Tax=Oryza brachyantha TaxID=4533 RepID=J3MC93_ORYBR